MPDLLAERKGGCVLVTLNRPEALNALNSSMIREFARVLTKAQTDPTIHGIVLTGAGDRAFCAGGDIKLARDGGLAWKAGDAKLDPMLEFFDEEYALNRLLFHFTKPIVAIMDGITMGGGVGLAAPCKYRVATTRTRWAMPEVNIGFFPDVGAGYYLTRMPGLIGRYLGLTGNGLNSVRDMMACKIATHFMVAEKVPLLIENLLAAKTPEGFVAAIGSGDIPVDMPPAIDRERIDKYFAPDTVEDILHGLEWADNDPWAVQTAATLREKSPTSLKITLAHLRASEKESFDQVSGRDLVLAEFCLHGEDLYEGIRAAVVDKDRNPRWNPAKLEDVPAFDFS